MHGNLDGESSNLSGVTKGFFAGTPSIIVVGVFIIIMIIIMMVDHFIY